MQFPTKPMAAASTAGFSVTVTVVAAAQDAAVKASDSHGAWYTKPLWIVIGIIALALILVLISLAGRRGGTTIVK